MASLVKFADVFLEAASRAPRIHRVFTALLVGWEVMALVTPLAPYETLVAPLVPLAMVSVLFVISAGVTRHCDSTIDRLGFFLLSWTVLFLGLVTVLMVRLGLIESSPFSEDFWHVGMLWLVAMWSVALADRLNVLKADAEQHHRDLGTSQNRLARTDRDDACRGGRVRHGQAAPNSLTSTPATFSLFRDRAKRQTLSLAVRSPRRPKPIRSGWPVLKRLTPSTACR